MKNATNLAISIHNPRFNKNKQFERLQSKQKHCQKNEKMKQQTQNHQNQEKKISRLSRNKQI